MVHNEARTVERMETCFRSACPREMGRIRRATIKRTTNPTDIVSGAIYLLEKKKIPVSSTYERTKPERIEVEVEAGLLACLILE